MYCSSGLPVRQRRTTTAASSDVSTVKSRRMKEKAELRLFVRHREGEAVEEDADPVVRREAVFPEGHTGQGTGSPCGRSDIPAARRLCSRSGPSPDSCGGPSAPSARSRKAPFQWAKPGRPPAAGTASPRGRGPHRQAPAAPLPQGPRGSQGLSRARRNRQTGAGSPREGEMGPALAVEGAEARRPQPLQQPGQPDSSKVNRGRTGSSFSAGRRSAPASDSRSSSAAGRIIRSKNPSASCGSWAADWNLPRRRGGRTVPGQGMRGAGCRQTGPGAVPVPGRASPPPPAAAGLRPPGGRIPRPSPPGGFLPAGNRGSSRGGQAAYRQMRHPPGGFRRPVPPFPAADTVCSPSERERETGSPGRAVSSIDTGTSGRSLW